VDIERQREHDWLRVYILGIDWSGSISLSPARIRLRLKRYGGFVQ
jgi:hypothetical protein